MSIGGLVRQDESWLSIDGVVGCKMNCKYCFLQTYGQTPSPGEQVTSPSDLIEKMLDSATYTTDSVIMIGSETDVFMHGRNVKYLQELLGEIEKSGVLNRIALVTKNKVPQEFIDWIKERNMSSQMIFYFSYSGLPKEIEPAVDQEKIRESMKNVFDNGLKVIHYWRPLMPQNTDPATIKHIVDFVTQYALCSVVLGLKYNPQIIEKMKPYWSDLSHLPDDVSKIGQIYPRDTKQFIYQYISENYPEYPVFSTNSCALSYIAQTADYNGFTNSEICQNNLCPTTQREICNRKFIIPSKEAIELAFKRAGVLSAYKLTSEGIVIDSQIEHGQVIFIRQLLNFPVIPQVMTSSNEWAGPVANKVDYEI